MGPIPKGGTVAVTGAAGFIGGWVVRRLLDKGYRVRACVRDAGDDNRCGFLRAMPGYASGRLTIHSANLDDEGCFDDIFAGCQGVAHVSHVSNYSDHEYVQRVCDHIIASVNRRGTAQRPNAQRHGGDVPAVRRIPARLRGVPADGGEGQAQTARRLLAPRLEGRAAPAAVT